MNTRTALGDVRLLWRLVGEARPDWHRIGVVFLVGLLATPLALLAPVPLKMAVDSVLGDQPIPGFLDAVLPDAATSSDRALLVVTAGLFLAVAVLTQAQDLASHVLRTVVGERLLLRFRSRLFDRAQRLSLRYHDRVGTSDSTYRIEYDARALQYVALDSVVSLVTAVATLAGMLVVMVRIDWIIAVIALAISPVLAGSSQFFRNRLRKRSRGVKKLESTAMSVVQEVLGAIRVVKAFAREEREQRRFLSRSGDGMRARIRLAYEEGAYAATVGTTIGLGSATVLLVGVNHVQRGILTLGDLLLVMGYLAQLYAPLKTLAKKAGKLQSHLASAERAFEILDEPPEVPERPDARPLGRARGDVAFSGVTFAYEPGRPVLRGVDLHIPAGARVGISGRTGSGKTTLASLLARLYDPDDGVITLDGVDVRDYRLADLRRQFGIVLQEPVLFSSSIGHNIAYGRPDATEREVVEAARAANAHDFISALPDGYDTDVGERGMSLSGGERQRISLARAFLKDAPILILDEPTSSVDVQTESSIMEAMERLMAGRTTLMIAHRLATLESCDMHLRVEGGRVIETAGPRTDGTGPAHQPRAALSRDPVGRPSAPEPDAGHPAIRAWREVAPDARPLRIDVLKERSRGLRKSAVYRLIDSAGGVVIAKCCRRDSAAVEAAVYRDLLPDLPLPRLRWYGSVDDGGRFVWLFIEEARGHKFQAVREHQVAAGRWLGQLHGAATHHPAVSRLPYRGLDHFLMHLRTARDNLERASSWTATRDQRELITTTLRTLEDVERRWPLVADACEALPDTLIHGDLVRKNIRIAGRDDRSEYVLAFDWEKAGYGLRAADLARVDGAPRFAASVDLDAYRQGAAAVGVPVRGDALARASIAGTVLRCLAALQWSTASLCSDHIASPLASVAVYQPWLSASVRDLDGAGAGSARSAR